MKRLDISVIIPTLNRRKSLIETLNCLLGGEYVPGEVIIIDQSDKEYLQRTKEEIQERFFQHNIKYLTMQFPSSTTSRNLGINNASNDILVFMDDDVEIYKDTLLFVKKLMQDESISMIGGMDDNAEKRDSLFGYLFGIKSWRRRMEGHVTKAIFGRYPQVVNGQISTEWAQSFFCVMRKSLLEKWNLRFDENLKGYAYAEDWDFSYSYYKESSKMNLRCVLDSQIHVRHHCSREWRISSKRLTYAFVFNRKYLRDKHFPGWRAKVYFYYSNLGHFFLRVLRRDNIKDYLFALLYCVLYRKDISKGNLHYELYEK